MVIGQEKICNKIDQLTIDTFPRSLMLVGSQGSGKHLICDYISEKFNLQQYDITETLDQEQIDEIYNRVEPYLYIIRANELSVKDENAILKFVEEPLKNSFIVLIAETENGLLQTIINRCQIWHLQNYKREYLTTFLNGSDDYILEIAETPGQIMSLKNIPLDGMIELADKILNKIAIASITNTLTLSSKIGFKNEKNAFDSILFVDILISRIRHQWQRSSDVRLVDAYKLTAELKKYVHMKNLDYKSIFEKYLIELRDIMRRS